ncbi:Hypothetical protein, putative [Bodo saltans]|uniref:Ankyrin repeat protein n=1 Tax=Bodo saltans TaxID=75058 RepID=A0A0S4JK84_BODSA|nr:Hypothetical protein, putative [Bodo saltans]|eukprot:CUG91910.1 Hypothetical protein, putative [Bodo saltans]
MTKSHTTNVWSCADEGDSSALKRAMRLVPSAATLAAWSYSGGRRRGVFYDAARDCFVVSDDTRARPATILHIAAVRGSIEIGVVALSSGASVDQPLGSDSGSSFQPRRQTDVSASHSKEDENMNLATPLYIAQVNYKAGLISNEFLNLMEMAAHRTSNGLQKLIDEETLQRTLIETRHERRVRLFEEFVQQGVAELTVEIRGLLTRLPLPPSVGEGADNVEDSQSKKDVRPASTDGGDAKPTVVSSKQVHKIFVRRCASKSELQAAVDALAGQSTSISFLVKKVDAEPLSHPASRATSPSVEDSPQRHRRQNEAYVELSSKNIPFLLCKPYATCVARPLLRVVAEQPELYEPNQSMNTTKQIRSATPASNTSSVNISGILDVLRQQQRADNSPHRNRNGAMAQRAATPIDELRKAVEEYDASRASSPAVMNGSRLHKSASVSAVMNLSKKTISSEDADAMIDRLYGRDVKTLSQKRVDQSAYIDEGASLLMRRPKMGGLSSELEESVARLCYEAVQRKADKVAEIEARVMEMVPRAKESTLSSEDADVARERLTNVDHKKEVLDELREKYHNDLKKYKKLSKEKFDASVRSTFTEAMEKRAAKLAKLETEYGDFRQKKRPALKISREQEKEIGDRLCKKS